MMHFVVERLVGVLMSTVGFEAPASAARSALSFPAMPMWLGIQCRVISVPAVLSVAATWNMLVMSRTLSVGSVLQSTGSEARDSVRIKTPLCLDSRQYCSAARMAFSST